MNLGINKKTKEKVGIKIIKKSTLETNKDIELVKSEIDIMSIINHKNIIKLIDTFENEEYIFIVIEYMKGGNLTDSRRNIIFT